MRPPAFGRQLRAMRDAGQHPPRVWIIAGDDWDRGPFGDGYVLALKAADDPRSMDWRLMVVGLPVHLVVRDHPQALMLACLLARLTAPVVIHGDRWGVWSTLWADGRAGEHLDWPARPAEDGSPTWDIESLFPLTRGGVAPVPGWGPADEQDYCARRWDWLLHRTPDLVKGHNPQLASRVKVLLDERREARRA